MKVDCEARPFKNLASFWTLVACFLIFVFNVWRIILYLGLRASTYTVELLLLEFEL